MNKAKIRQLAEEQAKASRIKQTAAQRTPDAPEQSGRTSGAPTGGALVEAFQERIYTALVGGSDFWRTQAGAAEICRVAYRRSEIAVEVWLKERAKVEIKA